MNWGDLGNVPLVMLRRARNEDWEERSPYNSENKEVSHTPTWRRVQNAVCLNGVGHDGVSPNARGSDAFRVGGPNGGDENAR